MTREAELARGFAGGQAWAYEAAYREHGRVLYAAALQVLRDPADAQDCVHDVLLRCWRRGTAYQPERGALRAFLAVSVRNEALAKLRQSRTRSRLTPLNSATEEVPDPAATISDRESIHGALQALAEKQRVAIELAYFAHLTHEQIAAALGEPLGTVKSRISAALRRLRETCTNEDNEDAQRSRR